MAFWKKIIIIIKSVAADDLAWWRGGMRKNMISENILKKFLENTFENPATPPGNIKKLIN